MAEMAENKKQKTKSEIKELADSIAEALNEKKAIDVEIIDIADKSSLADYFVLCSAKSSTHSKSLADNVEYRVEEKYGLKPASSEGFDTRRWILLDYLDVVVHIFSSETREFYQLERLWEDSNNYVNISDNSPESE